MSNLDEVLLKSRPLLQQVWQAMKTCLNEDGLDTELPLPDQAQYSLQMDPYDQCEVLSGQWRDSSGNLQGEIRVRESGQVYAEVDVIRNHPKDVRWFVEAVTAWGSSTDLKTELRLLPAV